MDIFMPILRQMLVLFAFIIIGFIISKLNILPDNASASLSKLENTVLIPALVMGTFIKNCTAENIGTLWKLLVSSIAILLVFLPISILSAKLTCKGDDFLKRIVTYGFVFSNFGFMGNAVVKGVFPDIFFEYTVFTLPFWFAIYVWGVPVLLMENGGENKLSSKLKNLLNPMLIAMLIGMIIGLSGIKLPKIAIGAVDTLADCMSPIAMILTGITVAKSNVISLLKKSWVYSISFIRLILFPLIFIGICLIIPKNTVLTPTAMICGVCLMSMPMGLNAIVIPAAYGRDTSKAAVLAIVTQILSIITIPLLVLLFKTVV